MCPADRPHGPGWRGLLRRVFRCLWQWSIAYHEVMLALHWIVPTVPEAAEDEQDRVVPPSGIPPCLHPERIPGVPLTAVERLLWDQLDDLRA